MRRRSAAPADDWNCRFFYILLRRRRSKPKPTSAVPKSTREAGSGTVLTSPLETPAVTEVGKGPATSEAKVVDVLRVTSFGPDSPGAEKLKSTLIPSPS